MTLELVFAAGFAGLVLGIVVMWLFRRNAVPLPPDLIQMVDAWGWQKGRSSRQASVRKLCEIGLREEENAKSREKWSSAIDARRDADFKELQQHHVQELRRIEKEAKERLLLECRRHEEIGATQALVPVMTDQELDLFWQLKEVFVSWAEPLNSMSDAEQRKYWKAHLLRETTWAVPPPVIAAMRRRANGSALP